MAASPTFYVRFFYGLLGLLTIGSYLFSQFITRKKLSDGFYFSVSVVIFYILFGFIIFHDNINIINYLKINSQLSFGNSVDMTLGVENTVGCYISVMLIFLLLNAYIILNKRNNLLLTINIIFIILFKLGFSRTDHYISYFVYPIAAMSLVMIFERRLVNNILFLSVIACLFYLVSNPIYPNARTIDYLSVNIDANKSFNERIANTYPEFKLKKEILDEVGNSSIDIYPYNNEYAFSNSLNYVPRPVFQNYMTLTPKLDRMNEAFFSSDQRPEFILWTAGVTCNAPDCNAFDGFDLKYSLNEDPLTSMSIISNYHQVMLSSGKNNSPVMLFKKNSTKNILKENIISESTLRLNKWYQVPVINSGVVKIKPDFKFTILGRIKNMFYRGDVLKIRYRLTDGQEILHRVNILNAPSGILLSPLLDKFEESGFSGKTVESFMLEIDSNYYLKDDLNATFIQFDIPNIKISKPYADKEILTLPSSIDNIDCSAAIDSINNIAPMNNQHIEVSRHLSVNGWLALSAEAGTLFDKNMITLTKVDGQKRFYTTQLNPRGDVAEYFKKENLSAAGYKSLIDLSDIKGEYILGFAGVTNGKFYSCKNMNIPINIK